MNPQPYSRRDFIKTSAGAIATAGLLSTHAVAHDPQESNQPAQSVLPRWRGFNLTYFFTRRDEARPAEDDFRWLQDWGFNFIRLPMSYELWVERDDWYKVKEEMLDANRSGGRIGAEIWPACEPEFSPRTGLLRESSGREAEPVEGPAGTAGVLLALGPVCEAVPRNRLEATQFRPDQRTGESQTIK